MVPQSRLVAVVIVWAGWVSGSAATDPVTEAEAGTRGAYLTHLLNELPVRPAGADLADLLPDSVSLRRPEPR